MSGDAVWLDVLPSMAGFGKTLAKDSAKAATDAGKSSGSAWAKSFSGAAGDAGSKKVVDELQRASSRAKKVVDDQTVALSRARGAQADAAAKVVEAEQRLADAREAGDPSKVEAAELRLEGARARADAANQKVENSEKSLEAAKSEHTETTEQLEKATSELSEETEDLTDKTEKQAAAWETVKGGMKTAAVGIAAVVTAAAAGGAALYKVGETFDGVTDTIRIGTGASGEALDDLVSSAKNVGTSVPAEFDQVGTTVADVNTRLGLTGTTLETFAAQALEAGRMLGEELDINEMSSAFNAFKIEGEDTTDALDRLFQVSQATGVGMNQLATGVAKNAPAVQALGFSFEETAAMVGNFDKAGLNTEQVMSGMSRSLVNLAKDGEEPAEAFRRVVGEIDGFLAAGDQAAAIDLASEVFGTRGASQFIGALESGALAMDDLANVSGMTGDTILGVAEETWSFGEQWQMFKNDVLVALEPVASRVFGAISDAMTWLKDTGAPVVKQFAGEFQDRLQPALDAVGGFVTDTVVPGFKDLVGWLQENEAWLVPVAAGIGGIVAAWGAYQAVMSVVRFVTAAYTVVQGALNVVMAANPIGIIVLALAGLVTGLVVAYQRSETFRDIVQGAWQGIQDAALTAWEWIKGVFESIKSGLSGVGTWFTDRGNDIKGAWESVKTGLKAGWDWINNNVFAPIKTGIDLVKLSFSLAKDGALLIWQRLKDGLKAGWDWIDRNVIQNFLAGLRFWKDFFLDRIEDVKGAWSSIKSAFRAVWDWINENVFERFSRGIDRIVGWVEDGVERIGRGWRRIANLFRNPINSVINFVWNDGLKAAFDAVSRAVGSEKRLPEVAEIPAFAKGGHHSGGWALVGEEGPELIRTGPAYVYTASETQQILNGPGLNPIQESFSASNPPHGASWVPEWMKDVGRGIASGARWVGDKLVDAAGNAVEWVRGGLAKAADLVLSPIFNGLSSLVRPMGSMGQLGADTMVSAKDRLVDWIRGEDDKLGIDADPAGRSLRGARPTVNAYAWGLADALGGIRTMQAFNQSMAGGHPEGRAVDFIDSRSKLDALADLIVANGAGMGLSYMAWQGRLWSPGRGWRPQGRGFGNDPMHRWHLHAEWPASVYDAGGVLQPKTAAVNLSNAREHVLTEQQWADIHRLAVANATPDREPAVFHFYDADEVLLGTMRGQAVKVLTAEDRTQTRRTRQLTGRG